MGDNGLPANGGNGVELIGRGLDAANWEDCRGE
jgi:hypothetical protein